MWCRPIGLGRKHVLDDDAMVAGILDGSISVDEAASITVGD